MSAIDDNIKKFFTQEFLEVCKKPFRKREGADDKLKENYYFCTELSQHAPQVRPDDKVTVRQFYAMWDYCRHNCPRYSEHFPPVPNKEANGYVCDKALNTRDCIFTLSFEGMCELFELLGPQKPLETMQKEAPNA